MDVTTTRSRARGFRIVASLLVLMLTAGIYAGVLAEWSAASAALPREMFASGSLAVAGGSAVFGTRQLLPGEAVDGSVVVANTGDASGRFALRTSGLVDVAGAAGGNLSEALRLTVTDVTHAGAARLVYAGTLAGLDGADLGTFAAGEVRSYRFTVAFPARTAAADEFIGSSVSLAFDWTAVSGG